MKGLRPPEGPEITECGRRRAPLWFPRALRGELIYFWNASAKNLAASAFACLSTAAS